MQSDPVSKPRGRLACADRGRDGVRIKTIGRTTHRGAPLRELFHVAAERGGIQVFVFHAAIFVMTTRWRP